MTSVLDLDPVRRPAGAVGAIPALRHQALQPHVAGRPKQIRADLALLEGRDEYAVRTAGEQPGQVGLAQAKGQLPKA